MSSRITTRRNWIVRLALFLTLKRPREVPPYSDRNWTTDPYTTAMSSLPMPLMQLTGARKLLTGISYCNRNDQAAKRKAKNRRRAKWMNKRRGWESSWICQHSIHQSNSASCLTMSLRRTIRSIRRARRTPASTLSNGNWCGDLTLMMTKSCVNTWRSTTQLFPTKWTREPLHTVT